MKWVSLVDCNSFYASCEKIFRPDLKRKGIVVLSNNDGCVIAASQEGKDLGLRIGQPFHEIKKLLPQSKFEIFSSNYTFYENISRRVMATIREETPFLEVYSIDEAFFDVPDCVDPQEFGQKLKHKIYRHVSIPVGVGIGRTKVLAKVANRLAKKSPKAQGVVWLKSLEWETIALEKTKVEDVWGVGRKLSEKLLKYNIKTAKDLRDYPNDLVIQKIGTKVLRQIQDELRGVSCLSLHHAKKKESILSSRSFGKTMTEKEKLKEAMAEYVSKAAFKLRSQSSRALVMRTYMRTNPFSLDDLQCRKYGEGHFINPTMDTRKMIRLGCEMIDQIFEEGYRYKKLGVELSHLVDENEYQPSFFDDEPDNNALMDVMDRINLRFGRGKIKFLICGLNQDWRGLCEKRSPRFTTHLFEAPLIS